MSRFFYCKSHQSSYTKRLIKKSEIAFWGFQALDRKEK
jgi:hypothetical protein